MTQTREHPRRGGQDPAVTCVHRCALRHVRITRTTLEEYE
ncbi:hypothetical protein MYVA_1016 [Mycolicibacterium vaccae 95051]|nr:hypothetical protein MYVA_1016 [Mycolicibacterium vaccae 95051]